MKKRVSVTYKGRVQGVGFRYTAEEIANNLGISGWVRNNSDGSVELEVEGEEAILQEFLDRTRNQMQGYIGDESVRYLESIVGYQGFEIR